MCVGASRGHRASCTARTVERQQRQQRQTDSSPPRTLSFPVLLFCPLSTSFILFLCFFFCFSGVCFYQKTLIFTRLGSEILFLFFLFQTLADASFKSAFHYVCRKQKSSAGCFFLSQAVWLSHESFLFPFCNSLTHFPDFLCFITYFSFSPPVLLLWRLLLRVLLRLLSST